MLGRTPGNIVAVRPLKDGVIADFDVTEAMLRYFIDKASVEALSLDAQAARRGVRSFGRDLRREARRVRGNDVCRRAPGVPYRGAHGCCHRRAVCPSKSPRVLWSSISAAAPPRWAVIAMGGIVVSQSVRVAGDEFDRAILTHVRDAYNLAIGERTAEDIEDQGRGCCRAAEGRARRRGERPRCHHRLA